MQYQLSALILSTMPVGSEKQEQLPVNEKKGKCDVGKLMKSA